MPFKPFRPPLIKKPPTDQSIENPAKRRRINNENENKDVVDLTDKDGEQSGARSRSTVGVTRANSVVGRLGGRKPLISVKNPPTRNGGDAGTKKPGNDEGGGAGGMEAYYNVLWRKFTNKKHKTWDGDGILAVHGGYAYLQDISGRDMGRIMLNSPLLPGSTLSIGGKDIEVDSLMPKEEFMSGCAFLSANKDIHAPVAPLENKPKFKEPMRLPSSSSYGSGKAFKMPPRLKVKDFDPRRDEEKMLNVSAPKSLATASAFKNPLKEISVMVQTPGSEPVPRHDPKLPGVVVMKRPTSVPKGKQIVDVVLDPLLGKHLREHQKEGVKFLYECVMGLRAFNGDGAILADEMGLGKTLQTIALLWTLLKQNPVYEAPPVVKKAVIVCPASLLNNWRREFRKWLGNERIGVFVAHGTNVRLTDFTMGRSYSVMVISYDKLRTVQHELTKGSGIDIVIADEGHRLKTTQNKSAQAIQNLNTTRRIILSGSPIQNNLTEFFAMVELVNPGVLGTFKMFMKEFEGPIVKSRQPGASKKDVEKGEWRNEELNALTSMFILRRTADILSKYLPPKTEYVIFCEPTPAQANIYRHVLASPVFQCALGNSENALQLITILKKLCNSPSLLKPKTPEDGTNSTLDAILSSLPHNAMRYLAPASSAKIRVLDQLLHNLRSLTTEKVVLVSNYTSTLDVLAVLLTSLSLPFLRLDGSTPVSKRQSLVDDFNRTSSTSCFAFLLSAKAGGLGLNLIGASRLVLFDVDWNPATDMQAMARIHRDGQKHHCRIYRMLLKGGIEEKIWQRQVTKIGLADSVMDQKGGIAQFSRDELRDLFRLDDGPKCQTHELVGCECGGRGGLQTSSGAATDDLTDTNGGISPANSDSADESLDSDDDTPEVEELIKASELKAQQQKSQSEEGIKTHSGKKPKKKKMRSLMQFSHIDTSIFTRGNASPDRAVSLEDTMLMLDLEEHIDDDVLVSLLKEEGNGVGYLFKKKNTSKFEENSPGNTHSE